MGAKGTDGRVLEDLTHDERPSSRIAQSPSAPLTINVSGMTCAACSARVQRALEKTPGVAAANVNLMTNQATVQFDPATTSAEHLVAAIRNTGYGAELPRFGLTTEEQLRQ